MSPAAQAHHRALTESIPEHLRTYIARQDPSLYTPIDHASWRFILRIARAFFSKHAHQKYLDGLKETGISLERIPLIEEMDLKLRRFGWRAVPVSGFIPPAAFMEFQSLGILPIACEMRTLDHLAYTPAPDIVHEAAGHAPIMADPDYARYLRAYGEVARKAIFSAQDMNVYEAIRKLSVVKEDPSARGDEIEKAQDALNSAMEIAAKTDVSEATLLARMNWWTVEYGLIGSLEEPKIYGAGLLSSVGESYHCLTREVKKIPFTGGCVHTGYDITRPQPQLYVTENFDVLTRALEEFAGTMAYRHGGRTALEKAKTSATVCTAELDSGLQISGLITEFTPEVDFLKLTGPVQLAFQDQELPGHAASFHKDGFSTPLGPVVIDGIERDPTTLTEKDFPLRTEQRLVFKSGDSGKPGIRLRGKPTGFLRRRDKTILIRFEDCTIERGSTVLFRPEWGVFDLACGLKVTSVFGNAADRGAYLKATTSLEEPAHTSKCNLTDANRALNGLYAELRELREQAARIKKPTPEFETTLTRIHAQLVKTDPSDYLLQLEILELFDHYHLKSPIESQILSSLERIAKTRKDHRELIARGLALRGFEDPAEAPVPEASAS